MARTIRTTILVLVLTTTAGLAPAADPFHDSPRFRLPTSDILKSRSEPVRVAQISPDAEPLTDEQQALVDWAIRRFALAGLELPQVTVRFDPSRELCGWAEGLYRHSPASGAVVTICAPDTDTFAAKLQARRTLLHEFAHAWDLANLSGEDRLELSRILGTEEWLAEDAAWTDRGAERFAETFVFALLDQPRRVLEVSLDCSVLLDAFRTATGAEPLGPGLPPCAD